MTGSVALGTRRREWSLLVCLFFLFLDLDLAVRQRNGYFNTGL